MAGLLGNSCKMWSFHCRVRRITRASPASHDGLAGQGAESIDGLFLARHVNQKGHGVILLADGWMEQWPRKEELWSQVSRSMTWDNRTTSFNEVKPSLGVACTESSETFEKLLLLYYKEVAHTYIYICLCVRIPTHTYIYIYTVNICVLCKYVIIFMFIFYCYYYAFVCMQLYMQLYVI